MSSRKTNQAIKNFSPARHLIEEAGDLKRPGKKRKNEFKSEKSMRLRTKQPSPAGKKAGIFRSLDKELASFSYISRHDLQEPLRKIQTFSSRILEQEQQNLSDNGKECLKRMQLAAQRMQMLIDDLVTYTRVNTSGSNIKAVKIPEILEDVKKDLQKEITEKNATIDYSGLEEVQVIPYQLYLLLQHLISNSLKFNSPNRPPRIEVTAEVLKGDSITVKGLPQKKKYYHISVRDNGIGFEPKFNERIFEVFQRLHTKDDYEGTGIGLAICKKIAENHKGFIKASGRENEGAVFDIYMPAKAA